MFTQWGKDSLIILLIDLYTYEDYSMKFLDVASWTRNDKQFETGQINQCFYSPCFVHHKLYIYVPHMDWIKLIVKC